VPIYLIFLVAAVITALCADKIDRKVKGKGILKKLIIAFCAGVVVISSTIIKLAL